ncbi:hypothetical protein RRG08_020431 [Elysia crispata]|uniref:Uncharacterized protein n=1 Tax=Elysia crispata TaxID=231223 RepID=A0AAE1E9V7_9GAST|nr:hypothetical protein RRG08_020431 [Elysia crispata]
MFLKQSGFWGFFPGNVDDTIIAFRHSNPVSNKNQKIAKTDSRKQTPRFVCAAIRAVETDRDAGNRLSEWNQTAMLQMSTIRNTPCNQRPRIPGLSKIRRQKLSPQSVLQEQNISRLAPERAEKCDDK